MSTTTVSSTLISDPLAIPKTASSRCPYLYPKFNYGADVRKSLARLLALITKGRISTRRAAVLAYDTNQLLHSHRAIARDNLNMPPEPWCSTIATGPFPRMALALGAQPAIAGPS
jgi:hypothetical protein